MKEPLNASKYIMGETAKCKNWYYIKPNKVAALQAILALFDIPRIFIYTKHSKFSSPAVYINNRTLCK